jgi:hypothetical protein
MLSLISGLGNLFLGVSVITRKMERAKPIPLCCTPSLRLTPQHSHRCRDYPVPMDTEDVEAIERSPSAIVQAMHSAPDDAGPYLYRTEGLTFAYIKHASPDKGAGTLFIDGHSFRLGSHMLFAAAMLCSKVRLTPGDLKNHLSGSNAGELAQLLQKLLLAGYIYAADD